MITPEYLAEVMQKVERSVSRLNRSIIALICERIMATFEKDGVIFIPATIADLHKIMRSGLTLEEVEKMLTDAMPALKKDIHNAFIESAREIAQQNNDIARQIVESANADIKIPFLERSGIPLTASALGLTPLEIRHLESAYRRTNGEVRNITKTTAQETYKSYIDACDSAYMQVQAGRSPESAILDAIKETASKGIRTVTYASGHKDRIEVAIARAVRTGVNQANADITLTRCAELGINAVRVSQHYGARVTKTNDYTNHSWWQGKVYRLDWENMKNYKPDSVPDWMQEIREITKNKSVSYPNFTDACGYGDIQGICGINCRHTFSPFLEGINIDRSGRVDKQENKERFEAEQKQRQMERAIAQTKREIEGIEASGLDTEEAKEALRNAKRKLREQGQAYFDYCKDNSLPYHNVRSL